jgi:hypothetical protein
VCKCQKILKNQLTSGIMPKRFDGTIKIYKIIHFQCAEDKIFFNNSNINFTFTD